MIRLAGSSSAASAANTWTDNVGSIPVPNRSGRTLVAHIFQNVGSLFAGDGFVDFELMLAGQGHGHRHQRVLVARDAVSGSGELLLALLQQGQGRG